MGGGSGSASACGALAQLGERLICIQEVIGSIPIGSTIAARCSRSGHRGLQWSHRSAAMPGAQAKGLAAVGSLGLHLDTGVPPSRLAPLGTSVRVLPLEGHVSTCGRKHLVGR